MAMDMCWYTRAHLQGLYSSMKWLGAEEAMCTWTRALPPPPSSCAPGFKNQFISHDKVQEAGEINITLLSGETGDHTAGQEAGERRKTPPWSCRLTSASAERKKPLEEPQSHLICSQVPVKAFSSHFSGHSSFP